ncbi:hypothetical protein [Burkholderia cepacia]|uniref:hypothetical protein n=1 Tax=Burkholderia cepacia TaxID=292 RepID=UPI000757F436|nr:hypothetical protein [Burkholderia cepacia]
MFQKAAALSGGDAGHGVVAPKHFGFAEIRRLGQHLGPPGLPRLDSAPTVRPFLNDQSAAQRYSAFDKCHADPDGARIRIRRILDQVLPAQFLKKRFPRNGLVAWMENGGFKRAFLG